MQVEARVRERLAAGDPRTAAAEAIRGYGPQILGYLRGILRNDSDAEDAFAMFAENVWRGVASFRGDCALKTWSYTVAWNAAARLRDDAFRRRVRALRRTEASRLADEIRSSSAPRRERQRDAIGQLRETLTAEEQTILTLRIDQGLAWSDVARVLGANDAASVRKKFERIKARLARIARERGLVE